MGEQQIGDGGGREFHRVAGELRTRITDGVYPVGGFLPSQRNLADEFGVSRDTVQRVLKELASDGWIQSRQGSGSRVVFKTRRISSGDPQRKGRALSLGPLLAEAFEEPEVTLDVYTLTSETLSAHMLYQMERIYTGQISPRRIALRMLLPNGALSYPQVKGAWEDRRLQERTQGITREHLAILTRAFTDLQARNVVEDISLEVRYVPLTPTFKLYLLNHRSVLFGPYEVVERPIVLDTGEEVEALDVLGYGATLTHQVQDSDPDSAASVFVESMRTWFESVWRTLAK
ncbi:GntR family transcriptional regulator [Streptomyces acidiscabies]|uniref:GntR family transcriptional regulator n=1 Tax=Streptomyces acidiscabies TaxID=42234 RepID=A0AAP6BBJ6_9ACTN|nr:GntR family transcriptional regulator [Streptomyces acidiscabies]MBP5938094.1 GntR family transcriptional regulator [Streptomyces sp. LBUM 1476]MBZ3909105.1 GntR family transcriptional regulator [Streptomyces acidiscabies]MDX2961644.1 GntR family transcriptional regulator [Streptomyces acidiscabies]MDX3016487.1 GntR family transcriptional regulator [Streptomyces acidiscabies]MDX3788607.1 GntR family transcriptional regulator [Streptomyces acidiscabies]